LPTVATAAQIHILIMNASVSDNHFIRKVFYNMYYDYIGSNGCYRGISVDPRFRSDFGRYPNNGNCGHHGGSEKYRDNADCGRNSCNDRRDEGSCGERRGCSNSNNDNCSGRPDHDCGDRDNCSGRPDRGRNDRDNCGRPDHDCDDNDNCGRPDNGKCKSNNCCGKDGNCCADGVMAVLSLAMRALGRNDTIDVEITVSGGYTQVVTLGRGTSTLISSDILRTPQGAISLCEITRLRLLSSSVTDPEYMLRLQDELERFIGRAMRRKPGHDSFECDCDSCVEAMQNYIMRNSDNIEALIFEGSGTETASVVTGTVPAQVLSSAALETENSDFVSSVELNTDTAAAVTAVTAEDTTVVTEVELLPASLVSAVNTATAEVSAPVTVTEVEAVTAVDITDAAEFASDVTVTTTAVIGTVATETAEVISSFAEPETVTGVISGIETADTISTTAVNIPVISSGGTGALQVVIPAGAFGTNIPPADVTLNVTVDGIGISYGGIDTVYALPDDTTLLSGITGAPVISDITTPGAAETVEVVTAVETTETTVAAAVEFTPVSGSLVTDVTTEVVGSSSSPETVEVISSVTPEFTDINGVGDISSIPASDLYSVDTTAFLSGAELDVTSLPAVSDASLTTESVTVTGSITTTPVNVSSPDFVEPIEGEIIGANRGIIAVDNTGGDISVYSSCAVSGAQLEPVTDM